MILNQQPPIFSLYIACLLKKPESLNPNTFKTLSRLAISIKNVKINNRQLNKFNHFYNTEAKKNTVPFTFLHLLVFKLHLKLMLAKKLPFSVLGVIHLYNEIISYKDISIKDHIDINISIREIKQSKKGIEFTLHSEIFKENMLAWESFSQYLSPLKSKDIKKSPLKRPIMSDKYEHKDCWTMPSNLGRKFALLSGDANPIHLHKLTARLFGFKQAIAHGMCTAFMCASRLEKMPASNPKPPHKLIVHFYKPILLPSNVNFNYDFNEGLNRFKITSEGKNKTLLTGELT